MCSAYLASCMYLTGLYIGNKHEIPISTIKHELDMCVCVFCVCCVCMCVCCVCVCFVCDVTTSNTPSPNDNLGKIWFPQYLEPALSN